VLAGGGFDRVRPLGSGPAIRGWLKPAALGLIPGSVTAGEPDDITGAFGLTKVFVCGIPVCAKAKLDPARISNAARATFS
jgi:hypothetical protein